MTDSYFNIKNYIRAIPDWPKEGVTFRDIMSLVEDKLVFRKLIDTFVHRYINAQVDSVVAVDARGFIIGAPLAYELNTGFVAVRKKGKLPGQTIGESYALEYGTAEIEIQTSALLQGDRVLLIDDLIATGGTMMAAAKLIERLGAEIIEIGTIINLPELGGSTKLIEAGYTVNALCEFNEDE